ncbi:hypothetical protein D3C87_1758140 [compost metagenome]
MCLAERIQGHGPHLDWPGAHLQVLLDLRPAIEGAHFREGGSLVVIEELSFPARIRDGKVVNRT